MKQQDVATLMIVGFISAVVSIFVSSFVFKANVSQSTLPSTDIIPTGFSTPDTRFFNKNSIDPAPATQGDTGNNDNPFGGSSQ